MRVHAPGGLLAADRVEVGSPPEGWVAIDVVASGVCRADLGTAAAEHASGPVTPGHEVAGVVCETGSGVERWRAGDRVAVGWFGGSCGRCPACLSGDVVHCPERRIPGVSYPGGWASRFLAPASALAHIPDALDFVDAAPMGCAGVTAFNAVRGADAPAGGRIAVFGVGGLGHLAIQFAAAMGHEVTAVARGPEREQASIALGASAYIDSEATPAGKALREVGGVDAIISTASSTAPVAELITGLRPHGRLVLVGVDAGTLDLPVAPMVVHALSVTGHLTGSPADTEQAMAFAVRHGIQPTTQTFPLEQAQSALDALREGRARFRLVLETSLDNAGERP
ncbi:alcohol dehydrogenase catalytic domain-containing protein [Glutamicibacter sp. JL.03c]|uniref:alcohol dehydrogenase catalytic domain-containing protein n=1 Tax=Glutamicibacter sp. JL.03c TaxID=2984842 RepID=UPI0021F6BA98|nr:alcohol dehydrogenase catalytic domain-containing protein [Glutamicibacter sp. JL.03c]UYQ79111.1 alcohol dehydrogenase catalytic domain-containing protein [Glutamicibacter sp. JL.03c]